MAVTIATGDLAKGGAVVETAGGTKVAIFVSGANLVAYKDIDGTPAIIGSAQTPTVVHGSGSILRVHAAIDSSDVVHVMSAGSAITTRDIAYNTISDPDGTPAWGTWEEAATYTDGAQIGFEFGVEVSIDSNDKPHIAYIDRITLKGSLRAQVMYTEKTGASWAAPSQVSDRIDKLDIARIPAMTVRNSDYIEVCYWFYDAINLNILISYYLEIVGWFQQLVE
jgi:hypothetical protein